MITSKDKLLERVKKKSIKEIMKFVQAPFPLNEKIFTGKILKTPQVQCEKCGFKWFVRMIEGKIVLPKTCANGKCNSPNWYKI